MKHQITLKLLSPSNLTSGLTKEVSNISVLAKRKVIK